MRSQLLVVCFLISLLAKGQSPQVEINEQVWKPFIQGLSTHDTELFMSVHFKDVVYRKENGVWKILVDTDSPECKTISEKDFLAAQPME